VEFAVRRAIDRRAVCGPVNVPQRQAFVETISAAPTPRAAGKHRERGVRPSSPNSYMKLRSAGAGAGCGSVSRDHDVGRTSRVMPDLFDGTECHPNNRARHNSRDVRPRDRRSLASRSMDGLLREPHALVYLATTRARLDSAAASSADRFVHRHILDLRPSVTRPSNRPRRHRSQVKVSSCDTGAGTESNPHQSHHQRERTHQLTGEHRSSRLPPISECDSTAFP
jgi:hypothetical protein